MPVTSKRDYVTAAEVNDLYGFTPTTAIINKAEELIDDFLGPQDKFLQYDIRGLISAGGSNNLTLETVHQGNMQIDFLKGCWFEIMGGTGAGQRKKITGQTLAGVITLEEALTTPADTTSYYKIWQLGKFPRQQDVEYDGRLSLKYYKTIPEKLRQAVAAQVEYINNMGDAFFGTDKPDMQSESIGDYSYSKGNNQGQSTSGSIRLIAPKAKILLRGIFKRIGQIT